jgi:hypothetical protein
MHQGNLSGRTTKSQAAYPKPDASGSEEAQWRWRPQVGIDRHHLMLQVAQTSRYENDWRTCPNANGTNLRRRFPQVRGSGAYGGQQRAEVTGFLRSQE